MCYHDWTTDIRWHRPQTAVPLGPGGELPADAPMTVTGLLLWLVGLGMIVSGLAIAGDTSLGIVVAAAGLLLLVYAARRDYDSSRLPTEIGR